MTLRITNNVNTSESTTAFTVDNALSVFSVSANFLMSANTGFLDRVWWPLDLDQMKPGNQCQLTNSANLNVPTGSFGKPHVETSHATQRVISEDGSQLARRTRGIIDSNWNNWIASS